MQKAIRYIDRILALLALLATIGYIGSVVTQIFSRTFLPRTPSWTEEAARYFFVYAVAFAAGLAVRANAYVAVDIAVSWMPEKLKKYHQIFVNLSLVLFSGYFGVRSVYKFAFFKARMVSTALEIPMQHIYFSLAILFGMLTVSYLLEAVLLIAYGKKTEGGASLV